VVADVRHLESPERYDLFVCSEVLYYLNARDLGEVVGRMARMSAPRAKLILVGKAGDDYVVPRVERWFKLVDRTEDHGWYRPFAVCLFEIQDGR
jgi:hypothetical protein